MSALEPGRIRAENLGRRFKLTATGGRSLRATLLGYEKAKPREFWALRHANLEIAPGETFGIIGRNGSGKSTALKLLARIYGPTEGSCQVGGRMSSLLELGAGFHPEFSAIENIFLSASVYGIPRKEMRHEVDSVIAFAELEEFAHQPVKTFSSGMFARLGFAVAMHVRPDVLLLDEVLAVGDEAFVQKCMGRIAQYRREGGTMILVTHDPGTVERLCERAMLLDHGEVITTGPAPEVMATYHERLAHRADEAGQQSQLQREQTGLSATIAILNAAGEPHHSFVEGEPFTIAVSLTVVEPIKRASIQIGIHDELGRHVGSRSHADVTLRPGEPTVVSLQLTSPMLRNGKFLIDLGVGSEDGATLLQTRAAESVSVFAQAPDSDGPLQIGGTFEVRQP